MGVSLTSDSGLFRSYNHQTWCGLLELARTHGWKPAGTEAPSEYPEDHWDGNYTSNASQCISAADAASIADALDRALLDPEMWRRVYGDDPFGESESCPFGGGDPLPRAARPPGPADNAWIKELISFCRKGFIWID